MSYPLFFSFKCPNCKRLCQGIVNNGLGPMFKFANIDDPNVARARPREITKVPTIVDPTTSRLYVGDDAFEFVRAILRKKQQGSQQREQPREQFQNAPSAYDSGVGRNNQYQQSAQETYSITNKPVDYDMMPQLSSGGPVSASAQKEGFSNSPNMVGGEADDIQPFMPSEMCNGTECYSFLDDKTEIHGGYYYLNERGESVQNQSQPRASALQYNPNVDVRAPSQSVQPQLPRQLQPMNSKSSKTGMDMAGAMEQMANQRKSDAPMAYGGGRGYSGF
jgi:hypothetical protein